MTREEPELLTDTGDFTTLFYVILSPPIGRLGCRVTWVCDLQYLAIRDFAFFKHCF